jgi:hypothetical protein
MSPPLDRLNSEIGNWAAKIWERRVRDPVEAEYSIQGREVVRGYPFIDSLDFVSGNLPEGVVRQRPPNFTDPRREGCGFGGRCNLRSFFVLRDVSSSFADTGEINRHERWATDSNFVLAGV